MKSNYKKIFIKLKDSYEISICHKLLYRVCLDIVYFAETKKLLLKVQVL